MFPRPKEAETKKEKPKKSTGPEIFKVKLVILKSTWVKVSADGKTFFPQYLKEGRKEFFISRKPLEITTGQGSNVQVYVNSSYKGTVSAKPTIATKVYKK